MEHSEQFDVVIIGAGISGLTSAALFSRFGYKVCVLEMDARPGGYIAGFRRLDYRFDSAIHWLNQCGPKGLVTHAFNAIGTDYPKSKTQHAIRRYFIDDVSYLVTTDVDRLRDEWIRDFPQDEKGIRRFFRDAKRIGRSFENFRFINRNLTTMNLWGKMLRGFQLLRFALPFIPHISYHGDEGVQKGLKKYFTDERLLKLFGAEQDLLSCLIPIAWAHIKDYQTPPEGGSQTFAEWLYHVTQSYGNEVRLQSRVTEITLNGKHATGVKYVRKGKMEEVRAKYIVASCDVETLYEKMLPSGIVPEKRLSSLRNAELYASAVTLSIALNCKAEDLGFDEEIFYLADGNSTRTELGSGDPHTSGIHILASSTRDTSLAPEGKGTLTIFIPGFIEQFDFWGTDRDEKGNFVRSERYKQLKQEVADILLDRVEKQLDIDLRSHIVYLDIATPITHFRYTGNRGGTMMGARPGKANMKAGVAHYKTPIDNLFLSGHWAELGGGIPVAVRAALNSTLLVMKDINKPAFTLLARYLDGKIDAKVLETSPLTKPYANDWKLNPTPAQRKTNKNLADS